VSTSSPLVLLSQACAPLYLLSSAKIVQSRTVSSFSFFWTLLTPFFFVFCLFSPPSRFASFVTVTVKYSLLFFFPPSPFFDLSFLLRDLSKPTFLLSDVSALVQTGRAPCFLLPPPSPPPLTLFPFVPPSPFFLPPCPHFLAVFDPFHRFCRPRLPHGYAISPPFTDCASF